MTSKRTMTKTLVLTVLALLASVSVAPAQDGEALVQQLSGKADAPNRSAAQLAEAYQKAIDYLLPLMSAENVESRYNYQIMFQNMGSHASRPGAETQRETLAKVMIENLEQAEMPATVRHWFVLQLERIGKGESVAALAKLLASDDRHLADYARRALEKNSDAGATNVLVDALAKAEDTRWKIGIINALGERQAREALDTIAGMLGDADPKVGAAAVTALANISGPPSGRALAAQIGKGNGPVSLKAAQGMADIAGELARRSYYSEAGQVYQFLYDGATKKAQDDAEFNASSIRATALNGLAVCAPDKLMQRLAAAMRDNDPKVRAAAVKAARRAPTKAPMKLLCRMMGDLEPYYQVQVLSVAADRGDLSSVKYAKEALASDNEAVRVAAIDVLTQIGVDAGAEMLMDVAINGQGATQKAANRGLTLMAGPRVEEIIAAQAAAGDAKARAVALGLLSKRHMPGATQTLLGYAGEGNDEIRSAAFKALIDIAETVDVATLATLVVETKSEKAHRSGIDALKAVLAKAQDKDAAAGAIVAKMKSSGADAKVDLVTCLDAAGGTVALDAVVEAAQSSSEALQDAGVRTLSNWPEFAGAEKLLAVASKSETSVTHYVLAMRGALRLIATSNGAPLDERVSLCFQVFDRARRDNEKRQAIAVMGSLPSAKVAERLLKLADEGDFKGEAGLAAVELASRTIRKDRAAAQTLAQKVRDLNISDEVNRRADAIIKNKK